MGISWARSALSPVTMFSSRYSTLAAPFFCAIYLAWEVVNRPAPPFRAGRLVFVPALMLVPNGEVGIQEGILFRDLRADMVAIFKPECRQELINRYYAKMYYGGPDVLAERMHAARTRHWRFQ